jgi:hypothetical protein
MRRFSAILTVMRLKVLLVLVLCGVSVQACGDDEAPAQPGRSVGDGSDGGRDSGLIGPIFGNGDGDGDDEDGGEDVDPDSGQIADAGDSGGPEGPTRCRSVDPVPPGTDPDPNMNFNMLTMPGDLEVTRASATWEVNCTDPTLLITLSSGSCPDGDGHEITFFVPAEGIEDSTVVLGQNLIMKDAPGRIRVRYTRPGRVDPSGEWGSCDAVVGTLDLVRQLDLIKGRRLEGNFLIDLTRCDAGAPSVQTVEGSFNVEIPASLKDICP